MATSRQAATMRARLVKLQHRHERLLRDLDRTDTLHSPLAFFLPRKQFAFPGHVTAIAFGKYVLSHGGERLPGDHLAPDRGLDRDLIELARDDRLELLHEAPALGLRLAPVADQRKGIDRLAGDQHVQLD